MSGPIDWPLDSNMSHGYLDDNQRAATAGTAGVAFSDGLSIGQLALRVPCCIPLGLAAQKTRSQHHSEDDVRAGHCLDIDQQGGLVPW